MVNAGDERRLGTDQAAEFVRDRREHLRRPRAVSYQRGHAPQRGLLIGKLTQPCLVGRIMARPCDRGLAHVSAGVWRVHKADGSPMPGGPATLGAAAGGNRLIQ